MRKLTTFAYAAIAALGLSAPITANAAGDGYVEAGTDELTYDLLYEKANGGSNSKFTIGSADGMIGTYNISKLWFSTDSKTIYPDAQSDYIIILAPEGTFIDSIELTDPSNSTYVRQSNTLPTFDNYQSIVGETFGNTEYTLNSANPKVTFPTERSHAIIAYTSSNAGCKAFKISYKKAAGSAGGGLIDHINVANLKAANPDGNFSATGYMDRANANAELTMTEDSGAQYKLTKVISNGTWWCNDWDNEGKGECYVVSSDKYIKSITPTFDWNPSYYEFYVSNEPITSANRYEAKSVNLYKNDSGTFDTWQADGVYKYFYISSAQERMLDIAVEWTEEKPEVTAPAPEVYADDYEGMNPECYVYVEGSEGFFLDIKVYHNDVLDTELSKQYETNYVSFPAGGKAGDVLKVEAFAYAPDYTNSETVSQEWTLENAPAAMPEMSGALSGGAAIPGMEITLTSETEGANISYKLEYADWSSWPPTLTPAGEGSGASPLTFTVPADAEIGTELLVTATATAEGCAESEEMEEYLSIISDVLTVPNFSVEDKAEVMKGSSLTISRSGNFAKTIHYIVNGGEEQTSDEYNVTLTVDEDMTVEAWVSGEAPFKDSEHVIIGVTVENFTETQHVIVPEDFTTDPTQLADYNKNLYTTTKGNISYTYDGGMYPQSLDGENFNTFYMYTNQGSSILYNSTPVEKGVYAFKITPVYQSSAVYVAVSDEPITEVTEELQNWDDPTAANIVRLRIGNSASTETVAGYNEWIKLSDFMNPVAAEENAAAEADGALKTFVPKYFAMYAFGASSTYIRRVVVDVTDHTTDGVEGIEAEGLGNGEIYNLNGVRVDGDNLTPGVYVRMVNGKAEKFMVK